MESKQALVKTFQTFATERIVEFECVCKDNEQLSNRLFVTKHKLIVYRQNCDATKFLLFKFSKGVRHQSIAVALPSNLVSNNNVRFQDCLMVERCPFCGFGFAPMWVGQLVSCKHFYHCWCDVVYFNISKKCIKPRCQEEMHESWWNYVGIQKPWMFPILNFKFNSRSKNFPPKCKFPLQGTTFILYVHC